MSKTSEPLVSVIIPVYNIQKYVGACLESVTGQSYKNLEIIVVDDGSTDGSGEACDEFAQRDKRVRVMHQKNAGLSEARNAGIALARGEWVALIDGDDTVRMEFVASMIKATRDAEEVDVVVCGYNDIAPSAAVMTGEEAAVKLLVEQENMEIVAWNKLYRKSLFSGICYPAGEKNEDSLTTYKLLAKARKVVYLDESLYCYHVRNGSIMDDARISERLTQRERAAREAMMYFGGNAKLEQASEVALLLAKYAWIDAGLRGEVDKRTAGKARNWVLANLGKYAKNPYMTQKLKTYNELNKWCGGVMYRWFRKLRHE